MKEVKYLKLKEIATEMYRGSGIKKDQVVSEGYPCVRYGEIYTTYDIAFDKCVSHTSESEISARKYFEKGDILFAITGESVEDIGKSIAYLGEEKCLLGGDIVAMKHNQNPKYLAYALSSPSAIKQKGIGKTKLKVVHTNIPSLKEIVIPIPSPEEQAAIVSKLDTAFAKIDKIIANAADALNEAQAYLSSAISKALEPSTNWSQNTLKEVSLIAGNYGLSVSSKPFDGITRYLRITDISDWGELNSDIVSADISEVSSQNELIEGDLLFARTGATVGKTLMYMNSFGKCLFAGYLIRYRVNPEIVLPKFLFYITHSDSYYSWITMNQKVAAQPNISAKLYNQYIVNYPNTDKQKEIIAQLDNAYGKVVKLKENYNAIVRDCDKLKQSILHSIFE